MNARTLIGAILLIAGGFIVAKSVRYSSKSTVVDLGGVRVSAEERRTIPTWVGGLAAVAGLVLIFGSGGSSKRSS